MRLWSLHPSHLDRAGLVAGWREALLAQAVLAGRTNGYRQHPQLQRFREVAEPLAVIGTFLTGLHADAERRGYRFDASKIILPEPVAFLLPVTRGQCEFEWEHLGRKLIQRSPADAQRWATAEITVHPLFEVIPGGVESWERP